MNTVYDIVAELFVFLLAIAYCVLFVILAVYWFKTWNRVRQEAARRRPAAPN
ncbi:MAG TPA: hypothetical protein VGX94_14310 [Terriglobia bacterium]|nr:hypothetical protein [Terriglobia bacterium]